MKEYMAGSKFISIIFKILFVLIDLNFFCIQIHAGKYKQIFSYISRKRRMGKQLDM